MTVAAALAAATLSTGAPGVAAAAPAPDPIQQLADTAARNGVAGVLVRITDHGRVRTVRAGTAVLGTSTLCFGAAFGVAARPPGSRCLALAGFNPPRRLGWWVASGGGG